jgi:hypothetical protein
MKTAKFVVEISIGNLQSNAFLIDENFEVIAEFKNCKTIALNETGSIVHSITDNEQYEELKKKHGYIKNTSSKLGENNFFMHTSTIEEGIECCQLEVSLGALEDKTITLVKNLWDKI